MLLRSGAHTNSALHDGCNVREAFHVNAATLGICLARCEAPLGASLDTFLVGRALRPLTGSMSGRSWMPPRASVRDIRRSASVSLWLLLLSCFVVAPLPPAATNRPSPLTVPESETAAKAGFRWRAVATAAETAARTVTGSSTRPSQRRLTSRATSKGTVDVGSGAAASASTRRLTSAGAARRAAAMRPRRQCQAKGARELLCNGCVREASAVRLSGTEHSGTP